MCTGTPISANSRNVNTDMTNAMKPAYHNDMFNSYTATVKTCKALSRADTSAKASNHLETCLTL